MKSYICSLTEGSIYSINDVAQGCGVPKDILIQAFRCFREAVEDYARNFYRVSRKLFGVGIVVDTPTPKVIDGKLYAGFWCGIFGYRYDDHNVSIVVSPRLKNYHVMIQKVRDVLEEVARDFYVLLKATPAIGVGYALSPLVLRVLNEVLYLADREPKRIVYRALSDIGDEFEIFPHPVKQIGIALYSRGYRINMELVNTITIAVRSIVKALQNVLNLVDTLNKHLQDRGLEMPETLHDIINTFVSDMHKHLSTLIHDEVIQMLLSLDSSDISTDFDRYSYLVYAAKKLEKSLIYGSTSNERAWFILYPSTKLYELYTYAHTVSSIAEHLYSRPRYVGKLSIEIDKAKLFFNRYPKKLSRVIAYITKGRTPRPDILVGVDDKIVIVDAKYRKLDEGKPRLLGLGDAERIAAYMLDACRNEKLQAVVAVLEKPPQSVLEEVVRKIRGIDGKRIEIDFVELNPDKEPGGVEDIASYIFKP